MSENKSVGYIHSLQTLGAVDGPGIRFCVFLQGCPLRCMYCHNPDTWEVYEQGSAVGDTGACGAAEQKSEAGKDACRRRLGTPYTVEELVKKIVRYRTYFTGGGGVTVSGGEPLMQAEFVTELFTELKENGIGTCLDTSGTFTAAGNREQVEKLLAVTDLVICDIKFTTEEAYRSCARGSLKTVIEFLDMADRMDVPVMVRHVVVPGYTDIPEEVSEMSRLAHTIHTLTSVELLPFHKMCAEKYKALGIPFRCSDVPECTQETIKELNKYLQKRTE